MERSDGASGSQSTVATVGEQTGEGSGEKQLNRPTVTGSAGGNFIHVPRMGTDTVEQTASATGGSSARWSDDVDIDWLSLETERYSGADLSSLVRNAAMSALLEQEPQGFFVDVGGDRELGASTKTAPRDFGGITKGSVQLELARRHFENALETTSPSSGLDVISKHEAWARQWHLS